MFPAGVVLVVQPYQHQKRVSNRRRIHPSKANGEKQKVRWSPSFDKNSSEGEKIPDRKLPIAIAIS
jgi:hypothetical protein